MPLDPASQPVGEERKPGFTALWIGAAVAIGVIALVAFATSYSPGPPSYTLTADALTIHDRFYPITLKAVDVVPIRVVDLTQEPDWRPAIRTNGFANRHYRSGWFRVAGGKTIRMYRADGQRLVLLPPKGDGAPLLLDVREPDKFVEAVPRVWSGRS